MTEKRFDFFSSRLNFIEVTNDHLLNIELWHYLSVFESHVYGVSLQYNRIIADLSIPDPTKRREIPGPQAGLDIYYYILTWDKLKKIYNKLETIIDRLYKAGASMPKVFNSEFRLWKKRIANLFAEFDTKIRNEYEHPSLESYSVGNLIMWGNIMMDDSGNIKAHAGKKWFSTIKNEHRIKLQKLRTDLFDIFLKHFSKKPLTKELITARDYIEDNIDSILKELKDYKDKGDTEGFNDLFYKVTMHDIYLSKEGVALSRVTKDKIYSVLWGNSSDKQKEF